MLIKSLLTICNRIGDRNRFRSLINVNASRIPAARPEGSLFAVSGFLSFCVRKFEEKEADEEEEANNKKRSAGCAGGGLKRSAGYTSWGSEVVRGADEGSQRGLKRSAGCADGGLKRSAGDTDRGLKRSAGYSTWGSAEARGWC